MPRNRAVLARGARARARACGLAAGAHVHERARSEAAVGHHAGCEDEALAAAEHVCALCDDAAALPAVCTYACVRVRVRACA